MDLYKSNYWRLIVALQKFIGIYFFQDIRKNYLSWTYVYVFTISFMIAMGVRLYEEIGVNLAIVVENIVGEMYLFAVFTKLTMSIIYKKELKINYEKMQNDWLTISDKEEINILHKYTEAGRQICNFYSIYMIIGVGVFLALPITNPLMDLILPLGNGSRPKALPYYADYGIDEEKYYYPLMFQAVFGGVGTITILVTYDLGFIMTVQHVVALFALANFRLFKVSQYSQAIYDGTVTFETGNKLATKFTIQAVISHQKAIEYVENIESSYNICWLMILLENMAMIGGGFTVILLKFHRPEEAFRYIVVFIAGLIHFYYIFLPGQKIINSSEEVFDHCYACKWYNVSEPTKNMLKLMMTRAQRCCELTGGKMFIMCMDTYCEMMKTAFSVFTLLR